MTIFKAMIPLLFISLVSIITSCSTKGPHDKEVKRDEIALPAAGKAEMGNDHRISLELNAMQKNHQLKNMRDHLEAVQSIIALLASDKYEEASKVAYSRLGSTTEMKLMCASFGDKNFEKLGLEFHSSADTMSEIFKMGDKKKSLNALSNTLNYCVRCHASYRQ
ncbi:MAG: hypothetical protein Q9M33_08075 [Robiginitomaculum sp.]|nr:hypothetical protein [Robiginitomaculum sp.]